MDGNENMMGRGAYVLGHLYWGWMAHTVFTMRLFQRVIAPWSGALLSTAESQRLLLVLVIACGAIGCGVSFRRHRDEASLILDVAAPYGIYLVLETLPQIPFYVWAGGIVCGAFAAGHLILLVLKPIRQGQHTAAVLVRRFGQMFYRTGCLTAALLSCFTMVCLVTTLMGNGVIRPVTQQIGVDTGESPDTLARTEAALDDLRADRWKVLTVQERTDLMQVVADVEAGYLGLPDPLQVCCQKLGAQVDGQYDHSERTVSIAQDHLLYDSAEECTRTVLHEAYHSYQRHLCAMYEALDAQYQDMYFLREAAVYDWEFQNYVDGEVAYQQYADQSCEYDARQYAKTRLETAYADYLARSGD